MQEYLTSYCMHVYVRCEVTFRHSTFGNLEKLIMLNQVGKNSFEIKTSNL